MRLNRSLAYPLIGLIVLAVIGTALSLHYIQVRVLKHSLRSKERIEAEIHHEIIDTYIAGVGEKVTAFAKVLKNYDSLKNAALHFMDSGGFEAHGDREPLRNVLDNLSLRDHVDEIIVADAEGRVVCRAGNRQAGDILSGWGVAEAVAGEDILVTTFHNGQWEIRGVSPLFRDNHPIGVIVVTSRIDDRFARKLSRSFSCNATLGNLKGIVASSLPHDQRNDIDIDLMIETLREKVAKNKDYPGLSRIAYYAPLQVVDEAFCLIVEMDTSASNALLARKRKETLVFSLLILIAISISAALFALKLINPIRKLKVKAETMTKDIADRQLEDIKGNEVDKLVHAFDSMVAAINQHIDERQQAEEELRCSHDRLEEQVAERTVHLKKVNQELHWEIKERQQTEIALRKSKAKLEDTLTELKETQAHMIQSEKMASVGQLAAGVAHEINNPTGYVSSNLNTLTEYQEDISKILREYRNLVARSKSAVSKTGDLDPLSEQVKRILSMEVDMDIDFLEDDIPRLIMECQEGTEKIRKIVTALKDFSHPGIDGYESADINKCLESTLNVIWNELKYKATVKKEYGEISMVQGNTQQLNQVFMNLLVNAAQAIEEKGEIKIVTCMDNGHVAVKISDTGSGIPEQAMAKIFDPFFTTKEVGKGTGLGLHIVYDIVNQHGGTIKVESVEGKGTTFTVQLPYIVEN